MYNDFYHFKSEPFENTLNAKFFFPSDRHRDVLASFMYGIKQNKGVLMLTGEIGVGKTQALKVLKDLLSEDKNNKIIEIVNPKLGSEELFNFIANCLMIERVGELGANQILASIKQKLISKQTSEFRFVLLLDEAQMLSDDSFEKVRILSNLEHDSHKLVNIVLVGQPELLKHLSRAPNQALLQRVAIAKTLNYLDPHFVRQYIEFRLDTAGGNPHLFNEQAINKIADLSKGSPRLINQICDASLFYGFMNERRTIDSDMVSKAIVDLPFNQLGTFEPEKENKPDNIEVEQAQAVEQDEDTFSDISLPTKEVQQPRQYNLDKHLLYKALGVIALILLIWFSIVVFNAFSVVNQANKDQATQNNAPHMSQPAAYDDEPRAKRVIPVDNSDSRYQVKTFNTQQDNFDRSYEALEASPVQAKATTETSTPNQASQKAVQTNRTQSSRSVWDAEHLIAFPFRDGMKGVSQVSKPSGQAISQVIKGHYGSWNASIEDVVRQTNSHITSFNDINSQVVLNLPKLSEINLLTKSKSGDVYVYFGSFTKQSLAKERADYLNQIGYQTVFQSEKWDYRYVSRVYNGPYQSFAQAQDAVMNLDFTDFSRIF